MATLNQIVYNISEILELDPDPTFIERLRFAVNYHRALLVRRDMERDGILPNHYVQTIHCLDTMDVSSVECCDIGIDDCIIQRTVEKVPSTVRIKGMSEFTYVGTIDRKRPFRPITPARVAYIGASKYARRSFENYYFYENGYIYGRLPEKIMVSGVFEDPLAVISLNSCEGLPGSDCDPNEEPYPVSSDLIQRITQSILSTEILQVRQNNEQVRVNDTT